MMNSLSFLKATEVSGVDKLARAAYHLGDFEWTFKRGMKAPQALVSSFRFLKKALFVQ